MRNTEVFLGFLLLIKCFLRTLRPSQVATYPVQALSLNGPVKVSLFERSLDAQSALKEQLGLPMTAAQNQDQPEAVY